MFNSSAEDLNKKPECPLKFISIKAPHGKYYQIFHIDADTENSSVQSCPKLTISKLVWHHVSNANVVILSLLSYPHGHMYDFFLFKL